MKEVCVGDFGDLDEICVQNLVEMIQFLPNRRPSFLELYHKFPWNNPTLMSTLEQKKGAEKEKSATNKEKEKEKERESANDVFKEFDKLMEEEKIKSEQIEVEQQQPYDFDDFNPDDEEDDEELRKLKQELASGNKQKDYLDDNDEFEESHTEFELHRQLIKQS